MGRVVSIALFAVVLGFVIFQALSDSPANMTAASCVLRGDALLREGQHEKAIRYYDAALLKKPKNVQALNNRAAALASMKEYDRAFDDLGAAIRFSKGKRADVYANRAGILYNAGRLPEALEDINRALEISPKDAEFYIVRGAILTAQNRKDEAARDLEQSRLLSKAVPSQPLAAD